MVAMLKDAKEEMDFVKANKKKRRGKWVFHLLLGAVTKMPLHPLASCKNLNIYPINGVRNESQLSLASYIHVFNYTFI